MKNYKIIFKDGTIEYVTRELYFKILEDSGKPNVKNFIINNNRYLFDDIRKTQEPADNAVGFDFTKLIKNKTPEKRIKALKSMIKGLQGYIESDRYQGTDKPKVILDLMKQHLAEAQVN